MCVSIYINISIYCKLSVQTLGARDEPLLLATACVTVEVIYIYAYIHVCVCVYIYVCVNIYKYINIVQALRTNAGGGGRALVTRHCVCHSRGDYCVCDRQP